MRKSYFALLADSQIYAVRSIDGITIADLLYDNKSFMLLEE